MESKNISVVDEGRKSQSNHIKYSGMTLYQVFVEVTKQIDFNSFPPHDRTQVKDIAMIIAEVFRLPAHANVRIGGEDLPAEMVAEVFTMLTSDHVEYVLENLRARKYPIKSMKTYLRTMLYNSVFDITARIENELRAEGVID